jgi:SAM-dependent methyltransferase
VKTLWVLAAVGCATAHVGELERIQGGARSMNGFVTTDLARGFLATAKQLPHIAPRQVTVDGTTFTADEETYYETKYGSPLSYARPLDLLATLKPGAKVLDFGYGYVGHLRMLATMGFDVTGVDVDPLLPALYDQPSDQGAIGGGKLRLLDGKFPADPAIVSAVGGGYDLIVSKNVLKRGYIHPDRPADDKKLIHLGASDEQVLAAFHDALAPGGRMLVYNICPAPTPPDKPFVPWSDGRSPWTKEEWEAAGFEVVAFDVDDTDAVRRMGRLLGWQHDMDLDHDLSVIYTLVQRR